MRFAFLLPSDSDNVKRVVITGATGFVGSNLVRRLLADSHEVHVLARSGRSQWRLDSIKNRLHLHDVDLSVGSQLTHVLKEIQPQWIFNLAAYGAYPHQRDWRAMVMTNYVGICNLIGAALEVGFESFVNTGSSSEYGFKDHPASESEWLDPNSYYATTKAGATLFCRHTANVTGLRMPTLRLYSVYGPFEDSGRLMPTLVRHAMQGTLPPLVNPDIARDFVYVDDVVDAYIRAATMPLREPGPVYNVGSGIQTTIRELVGAARSVFDLHAPADWGTMDARPWDTTTWVGDIRRIVEELAWVPQTDLAAGLRRMRDWFLAEPDLATRYPIPVLVHTDSSR